MKRGELAKKKRKGCLTALLVVWAVFIVKVIAVLNPGFPEAWRMVEAGQIAGFAYIWLLVFLVLLCCFVLGASSRKVTFGKRSRKRPVRLGNGRFRYPRMKPGCCRQSFSGHIHRRGGRIGKVRECRSALAP